jgi:hypothetical protein
MCEIIDDEIATVIGPPEDFATGREADSQNDFELIAAELVAPLCSHLNAGTF